MFSVLIPLFIAMCVAVAASAMWFAGDVEPMIVTILFLYIAIVTFLSSSSALI